MNNKTPWIVAIAALVAAAGAAAAWYQAHAALGGLRTQLIAGELQPIAALLKENQGLLQELSSEPASGRDAAILEFYLAQIRRDGVAKHADMKQRLDEIAENNTAIVTLIKIYAAHARTSAFTSEADRFRKYATVWRDRWNSVMELFMAGGSYAASGVPFPTGFPVAVDAEIAAAK
jgi:hypothetical protein